MNNLIVTAFSSLVSLTSTQQIPALPVDQEHLVDERGYINVFQLRGEVAKVEAFEAYDDTDQCYPEGDPDEVTPSRKEQLRRDKQEKNCAKQIHAAFARYQALRASFNTKWQPVLREAIRLGDPVAEVIWRQCNTTPIIERSALASTCDDDPARRKEAALRLREIGFEAAFDDEGSQSPSGMMDQEASRKACQARTLRQMEAGVYGGWTLDCHHGGNAPSSAEELVDIRRAAVIDAASSLVRRSFTYMRRQGGMNYESHNQLRLNRKPLGIPTMAWSANVFNSGAPYTGVFDPAWNGFKVYLKYDKDREIIVGDSRDAQYLRMLYETLSRSELRIDYWLSHDPRWSVFLLNRRGHHEWEPAGMRSHLGALNLKWGGQWVLYKRFENFKSAEGHEKALLKIGVSKEQSIAQFEEASGRYACELRYSGGNSIIPENNDPAATAIGYLPALAEAGAIEPFAPMSPHKAYKQVLVQCPQGEWPDNRNKRFLFLSENTLIEVRQTEDSPIFAILHWRRDTSLDANTQLNSPPPSIDFKAVLARLAKSAVLAEQAETRIRQIRATTSSLSSDELIASLTQLRVEKLYYVSSRDIPENLRKLIETSDIAIRICAAYRENPPDSLLRFNFMLALVTRFEEHRLTPDELTIVPDCLRLALNDRDAWVRTKALEVFAQFAEERDRPLLTELLNDPGRGRAEKQSICSSSAEKPYRCQLIKGLLKGQRRARDFETYFSTSLPPGCWFYLTTS